MPIEKMVGEGKAAEMLGIAYTTLRDWRFRGIGPDFIDVDGRTYYTHRHLEEFQKRRTVKNHAEVEKDTGSKRPVPASKGRMHLPPALFTVTR